MTQLELESELLATVSAVIHGRQTILPKLGATFSAKDSAIEIREPSARDLASLVERSSLMLQSCPGFEIKDFCAGEGCLPERGLMLTLQVKGV